MTPKLIRVSPSILAIDYNNDEILKTSLQKIEEAGANFVHVDVMDGKFVTNKTFDYKFVDKLKDLTKLMLDVHLMIENPDSMVDKYINAGADILTVHFEACKDIESTLKKIKTKNVVAGVAISPSTPALKLKDLLQTGLVDLVLVMGVEPGYSGQSFIPGSAEKVAEIREMDKRVFIEIDGGVTIKNSSILRKMGVNILVSGATVFNSKNIKKTIRALKGKGLVNKLFKKL